jgi:hypothetical protein
MKKLIILIALILAIPAISGGQQMACDVLIRATDGSNQYMKGYPVAVKEYPAVWGSREYLPDFIHLILTDCEPADVDHFLWGWDIKYKFTKLNENDLGYRYKVEVDPAYISASNVGKQEIKLEMQGWADDMGFSVVNFTSDSMTIDIPKPANLLEIKSMFADVFDDTLDIRRYYFSSDDVDGVVNNGGEHTMTKTQALNFIIDKLDE